MHTGKCLREKESSKNVVFNMQTSMRRLHTASRDKCSNLKRLNICATCFYTIHWLYWLTFLHTFVSFQSHTGIYLIPLTQSTKGGTMQSHQWMKCKREQVYAGLFHRGYKTIQCNLGCIFYFPILRKKNVFMPEETSQFYLFRHFSLVFCHVKCPWFKKKLLSMSHSL